MRLPLRPLLAALIVVPGSGLSAQAPTAASIDKIFAQYNRTNSPGCALGVFQNERIVYEKGYGMADLNQGIAITPETVFYIASTSKQFTALSTTLLAEQGKIGLDDPVRKYVPELPAYADGITIRNLVLHTSGIRDYLGLWGLSGRSFADEISEDAALDLIVRQRAADFPPGDRWSYSNSGYFLQSVIVKRVTGMSLREFAEKNIFAPLGMTSTHFHDDNTQIVPRRAEGYEPDGKGGFRIVRTSFALVGDGGLDTSIRDLARYDANFYHNTLGSRGSALIDQVITPGKLANGEPLTYASGLMIGEHNGFKMIEHGGSFIGFRAELTRFPTEKLSVAILCNDYTASPEAMANQVADLYLTSKVAEGSKDRGSSAGQSSSAAVSSAALDRVIGRYQPMPGVVATISRDGSELSAKIGNQPPLKLVPVSDTVFTVTGFPGQVIFTGVGKGAPGIILTAFQMKEPVSRLGDPPVLTAADRSALIGRYQSDELDTWSVIEERDGGLKIRVRFSAWAPLDPIGKDLFALPGASISLDRDRAGKVTGYRLDAARSRNIGFRKQPAQPAARSTKA